MKRRRYLSTYVTINFPRLFKVFLFLIYFFNEGFSFLEEKTARVGSIIRCVMSVCVCVCIYANIYPPLPAVLRHLAAKHFQDQRGELHAVLGLEGERAVLLGVLLVQAAQVGQLLDHLGVEEATPRVVDSNVGL